MKPEKEDRDFWSKRLDRRQLLKTLAVAGSVLALNGPRGLAQAMGQVSPGKVAGERVPANVATGEIPKRMLGKTGVQVSALCFGGAHWGHMDSEAEAIRVLHEAFEAGVTFLDNAWEYNGGRSEDLMGKALQGRRQQAFLMTKVCSHGRDKRVALQQLDESLRRLKTDYLDLWQIHEVVYEDDPDRHFAPNGAADALLEAKKQGKVRFLGFTGHKDPKIHLKMLAHGFPFDTCQMPLNVFDGSYRSFAQEVLPVLDRRGIAPIGMKSLSGNAEPIKQGLVTPEEAIRYVLSLPIASLVSGIDSRQVLQQNLDIVRRFTPMTAVEMETLRTRVAHYAMDGRFERFKSSRDYDGRIGREQHGLS
ncbi:MAG: aldo/keto reductase [Nitrospirae bacterium RBG_19FT_COMBO_58_9]|nr:MAG: aldo/keto reductase [Nitrospirae bacterium RBG_19FT_COMBO_58_9]